MRVHTWTTQYDPNGRKTETISWPCQCGQSLHLIMVSKTEGRFQHGENPEHSCGPVYLPDNCGPWNFHGITTEADVTIDISRALSAYEVKTKIQIGGRWIDAVHALQGDYFTP